MGLKVNTFKNRFLKNIKAISIPSKDERLTKYFIVLYHYRVDCISKYFAKTPFLKRDLSSESKALSESLNIQNRKIITKS